MGADIGDIVEGESVPLDEIGGRAGVDAFNAIYGFLANIRQRDGTPLKDSKGRVTSHLSGLLYRNANLYEAGVKPLYVFDGEPPQLKMETVEERREQKADAEEAWEEAKRRGDEAAMLKHAQQATSLDRPQVETSLALLEAMRVPWIEAPSEGEAQAARMCENGDLDYVASQDVDALLFGAPVLVRNLTIRGRQGTELEPERIVLEDLLDELGLSRRELIHVAILCGTDYNDGIHGVGPKTALDLIESGTIEEALDEHDHEVDWEAIESLYMEPAVTDDYEEPSWSKPDDDAVIDMLVGDHDFSESRVASALERIDAAVTQRSLGDWS